MPEVGYMSIVRDHLEFWACQMLATVGYSVGTYEKLLKQYYILCCY